MNLEHELRGLQIKFPTEPELRSNVLARLERPPRRRTWLVAGWATLAACGALLAIPQTRAAILRVLEIGGVRIERTETQPQAPRGAARHRLTRDAGRCAARRAVPARGPRVLRPRLPHPQRPRGDGQLRLGRPRALRVAGRADLPEERRPGHEIEHVQVDFAPGVWMTGAPHTRRSSTGPGCRASRPGAWRGTS